MSDIISREEIAEIEFQLQHHDTWSDDRILIERKKVIALISAAKLAHWLKQRQREVVKK